MTAQARAAMHGAAPWAGDLLGALLCKHFGWSWDDLAATPMRAVTACVAYLRAQGEAEAAQTRAAERDRTRSR